MSRINIGKVAPIPKGDWVQSQPYEKLNMVSKSGVLYIAKQDVPANTAITNTNYWMQASEQLSIGTVETVSASTGASATIIDGSNGPELNLSIPRGVTGNESIDDTKGKGDTDYVWSADKNYEEITNKAPVIISSASGSVASFTDGSPAPVTALSVSIEPIQDLHGYDNPWPAGGGKNKLPSIDATQTISGVTWTLNADGSVKLSGTASANSVYDFGRDIVTLPAGTYTTLDITITGIYTVTIFKIVGGTASAIKSGGGSFTLSEETSVFVRYIVQSGVTVNTTIYPQIESGSSATSYAPYSNICPISGWDEAVVTRTGKNLLKIDDITIIQRNVNVEYLSNGIRIYTEIAGVYKADAWKTMPLDKFRGQTLTFSCNAVGEKRRVIGRFRSADGTNYGSALFEITTASVSRSIPIPSDLPDGAYLIFAFYCTGTTSTADEATYTDIQLELGSTASSYEPYQGTSVTIDLDGTIYGGTVDVLTGEMTVDTMFIELDGTETGWTKYSTHMCINSTLAVGTLTPSSAIKGLCSHVKTLTNGNIDNTILDHVNSYKGLSFKKLIDYWGLPDNEVSTWTGYLAAQKLAGTPVQVLAYLQTPLTVQLSPSQLSTLLGTNNIWADTGDVAVTYRADTKLYIEKLTKPTEDDMTANNNIEANKFFMLGNSLYYSTAAIAVGTSIIPGDNCTKLSLADALNNLNS